MAKRKADGVERIYEHAKRRAMEFTFAPGQKIKEGVLASEFGVSRIPVREALNRLASEGFVTFIPNKGFFCRDIDPRQILGLYQVRAALETWSFRNACKAVGDEALDRFYAEWSGRHAVDTYESLNTYDAEFHVAMAELSGNRLLVAQLRQVEDKILAFRTLELKDRARREKTLGEHEMIVDLLKGREADRGAELLENHILQSAENAIQSAVKRYFNEKTSP